MPVFDFQCNNCEKIYETLTPYDETGLYTNVECPGCGSDHKTRLITSCNFQFAQPEGTDRWNNSHDYRFYHKQPKIKETRTNAMAKSHVGPSPYNAINDLKSDKPFNFDKL
jgi:putative FmdB family regulatory protein